MAETYNIPTIIKGDCFKDLQFTVTINAVPLDLTGYSIACKFRKSAKTGREIKSLLTGAIELAELDMESDDINEIFIKHKKNLKKYIDKLDKLLLDLKHALSKIKDRESDVEMDANTQKYLERFSEKVKENANNRNVYQIAFVMPACF